MLDVLTRRDAAALNEDAAAAAVRLDDDVRLSLTGVARRRSDPLIRTASYRYRAALLETTRAAWQRFADALRAVLRAGAEAPPESVSPAACVARERLRGFLNENPDLGRDRSLTRPG